MTLLAALNRIVLYKKKEIQLMLIQFDESLKPKQLLELKWKSIIFFSKNYVGIQISVFWAEVAFLAMLLADMYILDTIIYL